ncbi:helix-turn-helix domain-containing protein [Paraburkholderia rhizosphaerae]
MECEFTHGEDRELLTTSWLMGDLRFEALDLSRQRWIWRPEPGVDSWRRNTIVIFLIESGIVEIEQEGVSVQLTESSLLLLDASIPYTQTSPGHSRGVILRVPKTSLARRAKAVSGHEMFLPASTSADVTLLRSLLAATSAYGERCSPHCSTLVADHLTDLMEILSDDASAPKRLLSSDVMLRKVKRFIERNIGNEDLDPDMIARATGISRRYLARLFERDGSSVMRHLLQTRLERAKKILTSSGARVRISDVAWQCGFVSAVHFSMAFKKQYGKSPTDCQSAGTAGKHDGANHPTSPTDERDA